MNKTKINICRPGFNASCALCCGSHNFSMPMEKLSIVLKQRNYQNISQRKKLQPGFLKDGMYCEFIAVNESNNLIGCMAYSDSTMFSSAHSLFFEKTCKTFYCKAAEILSEKEILFAAELARDWYYYPLLINEVNHLRKTMKLYQTPKQVEADCFDKIKKDLLGLMYK
ncbi:MAG: hypothetical protein WDA74_07470 [Spirochaetota bacterium]